MKSFVLVLISFFLGFQSSVACDVCGCASGADMGSVIPQFQRNMLGLRYRNTHFVHTGSEVSRVGEALVTDDYLHALDLSFRWFVLPRLQLVTSLPWQQHIRVKDNGQSSSIQGLGDLQLTAQYTWINTAPSPETPWRHLLLTGLGVRLPNGPFQQRTAEGLLYPAAFQIGTGAYATHLQLFYSVRYKRLGLVTDLNFRHSFASELDYQFGQQYFGGFTGFYWFDFGKVSVLPQLNMSIEKMDYDQEFGNRVPHTGGRQYLAGGGIDAFYKKWFVSVQLRRPMGWSLPEGMPQPGNRLSFTLGWFIDSAAKSEVKMQ